MMFIKTISMHDVNAKYALLDSFQNTGFAVLVNHSIEKQVIDQAYQVWKDFFNSDEKYDYRFDSQHQDGYFPMHSESAKGQTVPDLKEFYHYYPQHRIPQTCQVATQNLHHQLITLAHRLLTWIDGTLPAEVANALSQPLPEMIRDSQQTLLRPLHYPPLEQASAQDKAVRAAAHEDINLITLLPAASAPGLEVKDRQGNWHQVSCDPGMIVVNVGDMLQEATGGFLPSTTHRVVNPGDTSENTSRYSMPLFLHARPDVVLSKKYTAEQYLNERLVELGLK